MQKFKNQIIYVNWLVVVEFVKVLVNFERKIKNISQIQIAHPADICSKSLVFWKIAKTVAKSKNAKIYTPKLNLKVQNI